MAPGAHRPNSECIRGIHSMLLPSRKFRLAIRFIQRPGQLLFCTVIFSSSITTNAHTDRARRASPILGLPDCMQNALSNSVQGSVNSTKMGQFAGNRILNAYYSIATPEPSLKNKIGDFFDPGSLSEHYQTPRSGSTTLPQEVAKE
jgi:hypothetical protein